MRLHARGDDTLQHYRLNPEVIEARLTAFERHAALYTDGHFAARAVALDAVQQVYQLLQLNRRDARWGAHLPTLKQQAKALEARLREADAAFFQTLRHDIRSGAHTAASLRRLFDRHTRYRPGRLGQIHRGYDALDALVQGLMRAEQEPEPLQTLDSDMVHYEPTPARAILDLVDQVQWSAEAVFYDLGAGLGHVAILVHLMTGVTVKGVEIETAYSRHAQRCAEELGLSQSKVQFLNRDARDVDYADGTVFFMYTPFTGRLLEAVLAILAHQAHRQPITVCTHGACTLDVAQQSWLRLRDPEGNQAHAMAVFESL
jgi:SAM-dependent methyltransferase